MDMRFGTWNKMGLLEIGVSFVDWIGLAQDRYSVMNLRVP
jgi:hypothetical protein